MQNIFFALAIAAIGGFLLSELPGASGSGWQMYVAYCLGLSTLGLVVASLAQFRNSGRQRMFATIALVEMVAFSAFVYGSLYFSDSLHFRTEAGVDVGRLIALLLPALGYVFLRLGLARVKRDIKMLASADRLR